MAPALLVDVRVLRGHTGPVLELATLADGRPASASGDGDLRVWNPRSGDADVTIAAGLYKVAAPVQLDDGRLVAGDPHRGRDLGSRRSDRRVVYGGHSMAAGVGPARIPGAGLLHRVRHCRARRRPGGVPRHQLPGLVAVRSVDGEIHPWEPGTP